MNQPRSRCRARYEHLLAIVLLKKTSTSQHRQPISTDPEQLSDASPNLSPHDDMDTTMDDFSGTAPFEPQEDNFSNDNPYHITEYPGAGQIFGQGKTFMDTFDSDKHASKREQNLYYPFSSRDEWEFACYLLRSSLSMGAIDQLLNLELVSDLPCFLFLRVIICAQY